MNNENLTFKEYSDTAKEFAQYPNTGSLTAISYCALGLNGEAGEYAEKVKKVLRGDATQTSRELRLQELGDVLWYLNQCCIEERIGLHEVAAANIVKLASREASGTIKGSGDER